MKYTAENLLKYISEKKIASVQNDTININKNCIHFDRLNNKFSVNNLQGNGHKRIFDLTKLENWSVVMLLITLFKHGYSSKTIYLEKCWHSGRSTTDFLDLLITNPSNRDMFMFEIKTYDELKKNYSDPLNKNKMMQLISYIMHQTKNTKIASYYAFNFNDNKSYFNNIYCNDILQDASDNDDFYLRWNKVFNHDNYVESENLYGVNKAIKKYENLQKITSSDTKNLYFQFLTILRLNSISDKPNAFMKIINLFLCKIADEIKQNRDFSIVDGNNNIHTVNGLKFQFIDGLDTPASFMKRLNDLYKLGMKKYLGKEVIEYSDDDVNKILNGNKNKEIKSMIDDLRLKKEQNFAFIEVYNNDTFLENFEIVKQVVALIETYKFKYETRHPFLGEFFEYLLNTSLKQEAGQFFTPYPLVDYMVKTVGIKNYILNKIKENDEDFIPTIIDYACGAGHFLISAMSEINSCLSLIDIDTLPTKTQKSKLRSFIDNPYSFATKDKIIGIEKDYRLAKTTKISTFLNGDGDACIISGDGVNKFNCDEYKNTILFTNSNKNELFDFVISNPPYSIDGFMQSFKKHKIDTTSKTFSLLSKELTDKNTDIETYFVERAWQLLKKEGVASIILPQSVLSQEKYNNMRKFILENFIIRSMLLTADITFSGTTTSPIILNLLKRKPRNLNYDILVIMSPKYLNPTTSNLKKLEEKFLGYSFSNNRNKSGITPINDSELNSLINLTNNFIFNNKKTKNAGKNYKFVKLSDILLNKDDNCVGFIYPKYTRTPGKPLNAFCKINVRKESELDEIKGYLEITNLDDQIPMKKKNSKRFCMKGDILVSSLCPTAKKIVIAKDNFMVTNAIHVLSHFPNSKTRNAVFEQLKNQATLKQMNSLLDGFKTTYAKISEENLFNDVLIDNT